MRQINDGRNSPSRCNNGGKIVYDKKGAQSQRNRLHRKGNGDLRIYHCPYCNYWHLSHEVRKPEYD